MKPRIFKYRNRWYAAIPFRGQRLCFGWQTWGGALGCALGNVQAAHDR
jgi:hypothetical protein